MFGYLFKNKSDVEQNVLTGNWSGGIDLDQLFEAEKLAFGWHYWYKVRIFRERS